MLLTNQTGKFQTLGATLLVVGMITTLSIVYGFQYIGGYIPCKLCLEQRIPYYVGIPVAIAALLCSILKLPPLVIRGLLLACALLMTYTFYLGVFHAGVEWNWWAGPTDCGVVTVPPGSGSLLDQINLVVPPSCDEAAGRFMGLSFAGWNVVASAIFAVIAYTAAFRKK